MQPTPDAPTDVTVVIEQEGPQKFRVQSNQLEQIGRQLRGRRRFSVFNSIVLPAVVTVLTTILTGAFQYVSWINTVRLQAATAVAERADKAYEQSAALIGERIYGTEVFIPAVRDLALVPPLKQLPVATREVPIPNGTDLAAVASVGQSTTPNGIVLEMMFSLTKASAALLTRRYDTYYAQLKQWKERYDELLTDIDYNLDRPIRADAEFELKGLTVRSAELNKISCEGTLIDAIKTAGLDTHSLKLQFAVLNRCFGRLHASLAAQIENLLKNRSGALDDKGIKLANDRLDNLRGYANEFRCVALLRIDYYKAQKEKSIVVPPFIRRWLFSPPKADADGQLMKENKACDPEQKKT